MLIHSSKRYKYQYKCYGFEDSLSSESFSKKIDQLTMLFLNFIHPICDLKIQKTITLSMKQDYTSKLSASDLICFTLHRAQVRIWYIYKSGNQKK